MAFNGLWMLGAAVILSAFSICCYKATCREERLEAEMVSPSFQLPLALGLQLVSLGMTLLGPHWWERVAWGLICTMSALQLWIGWRRKRR